MTIFNCQASDDAVVRSPAVADQFYPAHKEKLRKEIQNYLSAGKTLEVPPQILISPHAGYVFSGPVAGIGFATINRDAKNVICIGSSHHQRFMGVSIPEVDFYETPLGTIPLDKKMVAEMRKHAVVQAVPGAHTREHCLEVQLPFLQEILTDFTIVPIITGNVDPQKVAEIILPLINKKTLVVISSDFSHYQSHERAKKTDSASIETILEGKKSGHLDACGEIPIRIAMFLADKLGLAPRLLDMRNSYETAPQYGSNDRVVGYASVAYVPESHVGDASETGSSASDSQKTGLSEKDKKFLLKLARDALEAAVRGEKAPVAGDVPEIARENRGCFVTLTVKGSLRGCIGYIEGIKPLYQAVVDNAGNSALKDHRFSPVTPKELDRISVEVSVLTKPEPMEYSGHEDLLSKLVPGRDGIILRKGYNQSTFLPQVWDQLPDKVMFLEHLSTKAGLSRDGWKSAQYQRYEAIHFQED